MGPEYGFVSFLSQQPMQGEGSGLDLIQHKSWIGSWSLLYCHDLTLHC